MTFYNANGDFIRNKTIEKFDTIDKNMCDCNDLQNKINYYESIITNFNALHDDENQILLNTQNQHSSLEANKTIENFRNNGGGHIQTIPPGWHWENGTRTGAEARFLVIGF